MSNNYESITAIILAGGLGTRLRSVISDRPKPMADINGRPFLEIIINQIRSYGIRDVILSVGYMGQLVRDYFGNGQKYGMNFTYAEEQSPKGTGGAIRDILGKTEEDRYLVLNGDSYIDVDFMQLLASHIENNADISIVGIEIPNSSRYGTINFDKSNKILSFSEKRGNGKNWINAGAYLIDKQFTRIFPEQEKFSLEEVMSSNLDKVNAFVFPANENSLFIDIGLPESYAKACSIFSESKVD